MAKRGQVDATKVFRADIIASSGNARTLAAAQRLRARGLLPADVLIGHVGGDVPVVGRQGRRIA